MVFAMTNDSYKRSENSHLDLIEENAELTLKNARLISTLQTAESEIVRLKSELENAVNEIASLRIANEVR